MRIKRLVLCIVAALTVPLFASRAQLRDLDLSPHESHAASPPLVERVRQVTQPFQDVRRAIEAGYGQLLGCLSGHREDTMGVDFVNSNLVGDGELDVNQPEALIYESKSGGLRLVGVDYIVMVDAWHVNHSDPPVLDDQFFQYNGSPNRFGLPPFYELPVWA